MKKHDTLPFDATLGKQLLVGATRGCVSVPLSTLNSLLAPLAGKAEIVLESAAPGVHLRGSAQALGAPIAFAARIDIDGVRIEGDARTVRITLSEVRLSTPPEAPGPLADAIREGMIDTANPATLVGNMVSLPDFIVSASGSEIVIDLMRIPRLANDESLKTRVAALTSYLCVREVRATINAIEFRLGVLPGGPREAALSTARAALLPAVRYLWPTRNPRS